MKSINRQLIVCGSAIAIGLGGILTQSAFAAPTGGLPSGTGTGAAQERDVEAEFSENYNNGIAAYVSGDYAKAAKAFKKATRLKRRSGDARAYLGMSQFALEDLKEAQKNLEKAIKYETTITGAWEKLGMVHLKNGESASAQAQLDELEEILATCSAPCTNEYEIQASIDALASAIEGAGAEQSFLILPEPPRDRLYRRAARLVNAEDYEDAIEVLEGLVAEDARDADAITYLGYSHRKLGAYDVAKGYYFAALAIDDNHAGANEYLGELYAELGEMDKAYAQLAKLDQICPFGCTQYDDLKSVIDEHEKSTVDG